MKGRNDDKNSKRWFSWLLKSNAPKMFFYKKEKISASSFLCAIDHFEKYP